MAPGRAERAVLWRHPAGWIATGAGSGFSPVAPGTAGSVAALLPWLALRALPWPIYLLAVLAGFAVGVGACAWAVRRLQRADPGCVVWDEFVGLWVALAPAAWQKGGAMWIVCGFILFRIFDIAKPWPVSWADRALGGGFGVMFDDALAGAYAGCCLYLLLGLAHGCWLPAGGCP